jgi:hypothetical protein
MSYANCGDWIERASALVEHADGRLEIVDVEALLRDAGWRAEAEEHDDADASADQQDMLAEALVDAA